VPSYPKSLLSSVGKHCSKKPRSESLKMREWKGEVRWEKWRRERMDVDYYFGRGNTHRLAAKQSSVAWHALDIVALVSNRDFNPENVLESQFCIDHNSSI